MVGKSFWKNRKNKFKCIQAFTYSLKIIWNILLDFFEGFFKILFEQSFPLCKYNGFNDERIENEIKNIKRVIISSLINPSINLVSELLFNFEWVDREIKILASIHDKRWNTNRINIVFNYNYQKSQKKSQISSRLIQYETAIKWILQFKILLIW